MGSGARTPPERGAHLARVTGIASKRTSPLLVGAALLAVYVLAVTGTLPFGHNIRPLFEGIGPPPSYRWVKPPAAFASGNVPPKPNDTDIPMGPTGSQLSGAQSEDSQVTLNLGANFLSPHPPDTSARVHIEPLDPSTLAPVPPEFRPNGNAYRVTFTYQPSGAPATAFNPPGGNIVLSVPLPPAAMLYSADGRTWTSTGKQTVPGQPTVFGPFNAPGLYLGATHPQAASKSGGGSSGVIVVAVLVGALALALGFFPFIRRRVRGTPAKKTAQPAKKAAKKRRG